jgi:hypothetical protein
MSGSAVAPRDRDAAGMAFSWPGTPAACHDQLSAAPATTKGPRMPMELGLWRVDDHPVRLTPAVVPLDALNGSRPVLILRGCAAAGSLGCGRSRA